MICLDEARKLISYDCDTGLITWKVSRGKAKSGDIAGYVNGEGYICIKIKGKMYLAHRLAWLMNYGEWPNGIIDHIDHNKQNNSLENLRDVSFSINGQNKTNAI